MWFDWDVHVVNEQLGEEMKTEHETVSRTRLVEQNLIQDGLLFNCQSACRVVLSYAHRLNLYQSRRSRVNCQSACRVVLSISYAHRLNLYQSRRSRAIAKSQPT